MYDLILSFDDLVLIRFLCTQRIADLKLKSMDFPELAKCFEEEIKLYDNLIKRVNRTMEGDYIGRKRSSNR